MNELAFAALLDQIYEASIRPEAWITFLEALAEALHGKAVLIQGSQSAEASIGPFTRFDANYIASFIQYYSTVGMWQPEIACLRPGDLLTDGAIVPITTSKRMEPHEDWVRPQDLLHAIALMAQKKGISTTQLSVLRSEKVGAYSASEIALIRCLAPHVQRAVELHRTLAAARIQRDCALQGLDGTALGIMIVDREGAVLFANAVAEQVLRRDTGLIVSRGRLHAAGARHQALVRLINAVTGSGQGGDNTSSRGLLALPNLDGGHPLSLLLIPLSENVGVRLGLLGPAALIFINDPERGVAVSEVDLGRLYGLSAAEAKLLRSLLAGMTLADYAASAHITINTVKTHLSQIFAKTGRSRQSDVIRDVLINPIMQLAAHAGSWQMPVRGGSSL